MCIYTFVLRHTIKLIKIDCTICEGSSCSDPTGSHTNQGKVWKAVSLRRSDKWRISQGFEAQGCWIPAQANTMCYAKRSRR